MTTKKDETPEAGPGTVGAKLDTTPPAAPANEPEQPKVTERADVATSSKPDKTRQDNRPAPGHRWYG